MRPSLTLARLEQLGLLGMAQALRLQGDQPVENLEGLSFDERLGLLVDAEVAHRESRQLRRRLEEAHLRFPQACLEDLDLHTPRGLDRSLLLSLGEGRWVHDHLGVLITGPTGIGKTFLACALAQAAIRRGYRARYYRLSHLLEDLAGARARGAFRRFVRQISRFDVLICDEWGLAPLTPLQGRDLLEVIDERVQRASTVMVSQLPVEAWHSVIQDPTLADAVLDRLVHDAYRLSMTGESMRRLRATVSPPKEAT